MNASSESGECASLISTGSVSVFWAACLPAMAFFKFLGILRLACKENFPFRWVRVNGRKRTYATLGLRGALPGLFRAQEPNILTPPPPTHCRSAVHRDDLFELDFPSSQIRPEAYNSANEL